MNSIKPTAVPPLLVLSNGHGEDLIAQRILTALQQRDTQVPLAALPLVGLGKALAAVPGVEEIGPRRQLPSGGFSNQGAGPLMQDLAAGLGGLSLAQWRSVGSWCRNHPRGVILAVGDLLPLLLAWSSGAPFGFVGTPKSDWAWRTSWGTSPLADRYHGCKGSEWDPWEWWLMGSRRCRFVAVRDRLTARGLQRHGIGALAPGNPMLDGQQPAPAPPLSLRYRQRLLLLPGSRMPEAIRNLQRLLAALQAHVNSAARPPLLALLATGAQPHHSDLETVLHRNGFQPVAPPPHTMATAAWQQGSVLLLWRPGGFDHWAAWADLGLATAGTATEQLVGRGVPALSLPGPGPQFTAAFARRQSRLLGGAVVVCPTARAMDAQLRLLLGDASRRQQLGRMGQRRMGQRGGSAALAELVQQRLLRA